MRIAFFAVVLMAASSLRAGDRAQEGMELLVGPAEPANPFETKAGHFVVRDATVAPPENSKDEASLHFDRTASGGERCIAELERPLKAGEHLRVQLKARLLKGSHLQFGFGSNDVGERVQGAMLTCFVSLMEGGKIGCYDGSPYRIIKGVKHKPGEWQDYTLDYVVGSDQMLLTVGQSQTAISVPFEKFENRPGTVNRVFISTGHESAQGDVKGLRAYAVKEPVISRLPVFGRIVWRRLDVPLIKPGPRAGFSGAGLAAADGKIFLYGGFIPDGDGSMDKARRTSRWTFCFDPATETWTKLPDLPERREYLAGTASGNSVFLLGGGVQGPFVAHPEVFELDAARSDAGWKALPSLNTPRTHLAVGAVKNQLIAVGGNQYDGAVKGYGESTIRGITESLNLKDIASGWRVRASIPGAPRGWSAAAATETKLYLFGGLTYAPTRHRLKETIAFDPARNAWSQHAASPLAVSGWKAGLFQNRYAILVGGTYETSPSSAYRWNAQPLVYDTREDRWMRLTNSALPPGGVYNDPAVAVLGSTIYVAGGEGAGGTHYSTLLVGEIQPAP